MGRHLRGDGEGTKVRGEEGQGGREVGGGNRGRAPDADITVRHKLSKTIVKLDKSVKGRHRAVPCPIDVLRQTEYCPSWLEVRPVSCSVTGRDKSDGDQGNLISTYNSFLWQGPGGIKTAPRLPNNILTDLKLVKLGSRNLSQGIPDDTKTFCTGSQTKLPVIERTPR